MRRNAFLVTLVVVSCIAAGAVDASIEDGIPRPANFADEPTSSYGPVPELTTSDGSPADCEWYGFANLLYPDTITLPCLDEMRAALANETENPPSSLRPFLYYTLRRMIDPVSKESFCYHGCFNLRISSGPAPSPYPSVAAPSYSPAAAPEYYDGPAMAPVVVDSPYGSPALAPAPESGMD